MFTAPALLPLEEGEDVLKAGAKPKTQFDEVSKMEPDRRGFQFGEKVEFHDGMSAETVLHEPTSEPSSSRQSLPSQVLPLVLGTSREESERIRHELGREIWKCAAANCDAELGGKKNVHYFKHNHKYFCKACYDGERAFKTKAAKVDLKAAGREIWKCAAANCDAELDGKKNVDYFRHNHMYFCKACYDGGGAFKTKAAKVDLKAASAGAAAPSARAALPSAQYVCSCGKELVGKKNQDYFKWDRKYFCKDCYDAL